ncbi:hypothetical protein PINS_up014108 [Pythium insidiosum]|nr:hypothetical protein PINS_up014108 [Pythium insidiosum]
MPLPLGPPAVKADAPHVPNPNGSYSNGGNPNGGNPNGSANSQSRVGGGNRTSFLTRLTNFQSKQVSVVPYAPERLSITQEVITPTVQAMLNKAVRLFGWRCRVGVWV